MTDIPDADFAAEAYTGGFDKVMPATGQYSPMYLTVDILNAHNS